MKGRISICLWGPLALMVAGSCRPVEQRLSAKQYFAEATEAFNQEDFTSAIVRYNYLLDQYPLNPYAEEAQLKIAYAYYLNENYAEAIAAFGDFERMYPISSHMPFVEYYRGICYLRQMRTADRDQGVTEKALQHFQLVMERYPDNPFASMAQEKIRVCRETLAGHELYVADFYKSYYNATAVLSRLRGILENYPETEAFLTALSRLEAGFRQAGREDLAALAKKTLAYHQNSTAPTEELAKVALSSPTLNAQDRHSDDAQDRSFDAAQDRPSDDAQDRPSDDVQNRPSGVDPLSLLIAEIKKLEKGGLNGADKASDDKAPAVDGGPTLRQSSGEAEHRHGH